MGRRDIKVYALLAVLTSGGTALVSGLLAPSLHVAPFLVWGGTLAIVVSGVWLFRLYGSAPAVVAAAEAVVAAAEAVVVPEREFLAPEITPQVLAEKIDGRTSLQIDGITKTYAGKWMRFAGAVSNVSGTEGSYYYLQLHTGGLWNLTVMFDKNVRDQMMALNVGDWVEIEGRIDSLRMGVALVSGVLLHVGPPPKPKKPRAPRKRAPSKMEL